MSNYTEHININYKILSIMCKDETIQDKYILYSRNSVHFLNSLYKFQCNEVDKYNTRLHQFIRAHGGWNNWMIIIMENFYGTTEEVKYIKRRWIEFLNPSLNKIIPTRSHQEYYVENRERLTQRSREYINAHKGPVQICACGGKHNKYTKKRHLQTRKHKLWETRANYRINQQIQSEVDNLLYNMS